MFVAMYPQLGAAFLFLFALAVIGTALFAWVAYWGPCGFRTSPPQSRAGRTARLLATGLALALAVTIVPMRRAGDWHHEQTAAPASASCARSIDRFLYGYIPSYDWIGNAGQQQLDHSGSIVTLGGCGRQVAGRVTWVVDVPYMAAQLAVLGVVLLPFWRAKRE